MDYIKYKLVSSYLKKICDLKSCQIIQEKESVKKKCMLDFKTELIDIEAPAKTVEIFPDSMHSIAL
jgi:hypothetical protein